MTAWDLVMDPIMVAGGHRVWDTSGAYFGIPLQNFWGWWLTIFCTYALYMLISGKAVQAPEVSFDRLALVSYIITMLGITLPTFLYGTGNLGMIGLFAMLPWVVAGWLKMS